MLLSPLTRDGSGHIGGVSLTHELAEGGIAGVFRARRTTTQEGQGALPLDFGALGGMFLPSIEGGGIDAKFLYFLFGIAQALACREAHADKGVAVAAIIN